MMLTTNDILGQFPFGLDLDFVLQETGNSLQGTYQIDAVIPDFVYQSIYRFDIVFEKDIFSASIASEMGEIKDKLIWLDKKANIIIRNLRPIPKNPKPIKYATPTPPDNGVKPLHGAVDKL